MNSPAIHSLAWLPMLVVLGCAVTGSGGLRPTQDQFSSSWVTCAMGGATVTEEDGLVLMLQLKNPSSRDLWVTVAFHTPMAPEPSEVTEALPRRRAQMFSWPQDSILAERDYPVEVRIYGDAGQTELLETVRTKLHFDEEGAEWFSRAAAAVRE